MPVYRVRVSLGGFPGAQGLNTWWFEGDGLTPANASILGDRIRLFYNDVASKLVVPTAVNVQTDVAILDEVTGQLAGSVGMDTPPPAVSASGSLAALSRATQLKLRFKTSTVSDGRFIQGGIFLGPISATVLDNNGALKTADKTTIVNALTTRMTGLTNAAHAVYRQPRPPEDKLGARDGEVALVSSYDIMPLPAVLRSRRD